MLEHVEQQHGVDPNVGKQLREVDGVDALANHVVYDPSRVVRRVRIKLNPDNARSGKFLLDELARRAAATADIEHDARRIVEEAHDLGARTLVVLRIEDTVGREVRLPDGFGRHQIGCRINRCPVQPGSRNACIRPGMQDARSRWDRCAACR